MIYVLLKKGATPLKAVHCAFVAPFHILDAKVRQKVARGKKKCSKKSQRVNESTGQQVNKLVSDRSDKSDSSDAHKCKGNDIQGVPVII